MKWESFSDFLAMGGYAGFVWSAYAITILVLTFNLVWPVLLERRNRQQVRDQMKIDGDAR